MSRNTDYMRGVVSGFRRVSLMTRAQKKERTADWATECADRLMLNPDAKLPPAPAYKGAVIHVEDREKTAADLANMPDEQLAWLNEQAIRAMRDRLGWEQSP